MKSPEIEADAINSREFIRVDSPTYVDIVEPSILESANRRIHPKGEPSTYCQLLSYSVVYGAVHEFCPLSGRRRIVVHVQQHLPSFSFFSFSPFFVSPSPVAAFSVSDLGKPLSSNKRNSLAFDFIRLILVWWGCYIISMLNVSYMFCFPPI